MFVEGILSALQLTMLDGLKRTAAQHYLLAEMRLFHDAEADMTPHPFEGVY